MYLFGSTINIELTALLTCALLCKVEAWVTLVSKTDTDYNDRGTDKRLDDSISLPQTSDLTFTSI